MNTERTTPLVPASLTSQREAELLAILGTEREAGRTFGATAEAALLELTRLRAGYGPATVSA